MENFYTFLPRMENFYTFFAPHGKFLYFFAPHGKFLYFFFAPQGKKTFILFSRYLANKTGNGKAGKKSGKTGNGDDLGIYDNDMQ
jgi:hypothetical protein